MGPSQGGIFIKVKTTLMSKRPISTSTLVVRRLCSMISDDDSNNRNNAQNPPEPIPNRPLRGERPFNSHNQPQRRSQLPHHVQSDTSFLEKFKLAADNKTQNDTTAAEPKTIKRDQAPPPQDADEIFKKMKETGLIPNAVAMLDGLCKDGLVQEAMKLFAQMRERGTIPEVVIYTAVVDGFCKAHKFDDAVRIFRKMQTNGISPNAFTYTVLIQGLYKSNKLEDAIDYSIEMLEAGHSPNVTTFVGLVDGLCREKGVEEARTVVATLTQKGFHINDKAVRDFLDKKAPFVPSVWEAIFGKKTSQSQKPF